MTDDKSSNRAQRELRRFQLAHRVLRGQLGQADWVKSLTDEDRGLLFEELKSHQSLHVTQGNEEEGRLIAELMGQAAAGLEPYEYKWHRLRISECERRGLGGKALQLMGELYQKYRHSRSHRARSAEVVMEFGILNDRHGDKSDALRLFRHSVARYERSESAYNLTAAWFNSASVLYDLGRIKASLNACEKGLTIESGRFLDLKTHLLLQRANCREKTREVDLACQDYLEAAHGYAQLGRRRQQSNILFRVGWLKGREQKLLDCRNHLYAALKISKELDYASGLARFHLERALYLLSVGMKTLVRQHLQQAVVYSDLARSDRTDKLARGALFRLLIHKKRPLSFYLRAKGPETDTGLLTAAQRGTYSHRTGDGFGTRVWRNSPRKAGKDVTFLARLLAELGDKAGRFDLECQSKAVSAWQRSVRQGKRIL